MEAASSATRRASFGLFVLDMKSGGLYRGTVRVKLQDLPFRVLLVLLERPGEVVTREELIGRVWPAGTFVQFGSSLNVALKRLRYALGDSPDNPVFIETIPKRGYRFIAPVDFEIPSPENPTPAVPDEVVLKPPGRSKIAPRVWLIAAALVAAVALGTAIVRVYRHPIAPSLSRRLPSVAILPLANVGAAPDVEYLRYSIADDVANILASARSISLRPFAAASSPASADAEQAGKSMQVDYVVSGAFLREQQEIRVTLEVTDVAANRVVWRGSSRGSTGDLLRLHHEIAENVLESVIPALHAAEPPSGSLPAAENERAFALYFHSLGAPRDPGPNKLVIADLEKAVKLDSAYAPAWGELAWRYYLDGQYSDGGTQAYEEARKATRRAVQLDPGGVYNTVVLTVEQGDLYAAYREAADLVRRRPDLPDSHYQMSVVLRYAGLLQEAAAECDTANRMDPTYFRFRSCFIVFMHLQQYARAQDFVRLDGSSSWANANLTSILLRQSERAQALPFAQASSSSQLPGAELQYALLSGAPAQTIAALARQFHDTIAAQPDPEAKERAAELLSYAGYLDLAESLLRDAIHNQYCSFPMIDSEPMFAPLRQLPEYPTIRSQAAKCQADFLARLKDI